MYCKYCGQPLNDNQAVCLNCGVKVGDGNKHCPNCGKEVNPQAVFCVNCGVALTKQSAKTGMAVDRLSNEAAWLPEGKDKLTALLLCLFFGGFGIHNFYLGEKKKGIIKIVFCLLFGISAILALIDLIKMITDNYVVDPKKAF